MKKWVLMLLVLVVASTAEAGMKIKAGSPGSPLAPNIVLAWAYNPADNTSHAIVTANLAGVAFGGLPCFYGGVGIAGAGLDGAFGDFTFAISVPLVTCYIPKTVLVFQGGWEKPVAASQVITPPAGGVRAVLGNHVWYFGVGGSFGSNPTAKSKIWSGKSEPKKASLDREGEVAKLLALQDAACKEVSQ